MRHLDEARRVLNDVDVVDAVDAPHGPAAVQAQQVDACGGSCQVCKVYRLGILPTLAENDSCIEEGLELFFRLREFDEVPRQCLSDLNRAVE